MAIRIRLIAALGLASLVTVTGCAWLGAPHLGGSEPSQAENRKAAIFAAVVRQLVTRDHTYGQSAPRCDAVYVLDGPVPRVSKLRRPGRRPARPFSDDLKSVIAASLEDLPPVSFVDSIAEAFPDSMARVVKGREVMVLLGPIRGDALRAEVGASLWIDGWAATWLTYVVQLRGGEWRFTGTTGPIAIA
jgi:hypothetical protein